jgi:predicted transcriptional regulator
METELQYDRVKTAESGGGSGEVMSVLHSQQMSNTITVRVPEDLAEWLNDAARRTGVSKSGIIREELEKARISPKRPFLHLAGTVAGPADLSSRKGFSRK